LAGEKRRVPELPEVETIVRDLQPLAGRTLSHPRLSHTDVLRDVTATRLLKALAGARVVAVTRRAKHVVMELAGGHRLIVQPGMSGALILSDGPLTGEQAGYGVLRLDVGGGATLTYRDVRRLGTILLLDAKGWAAYTSRIGPEPLADDFDLARFAATLAGTRQAIKKVIMDQRRIAGVGNIYAQEALFLARIDPSRPAHRLNEADQTRLHRAIRRVLEQAVRSKGTTVRDYRTGTGQRGSFQFKLQVYDRAGLPCRRCKTPLGTTHAIDGRQTTFCWRCQSDA
jgi:formamidopyrimidine-DNA glycosylase